MKTSSIILIIMLVCIIVVACAVCSSTGIIANIFNSSVGEMPKIGEAAPDFELTTIDGTPISLSQYRGQAVLINFWAVWCHPCVEEMPLLQDRYLQHYPDLIILALEDGSSKNEIEAVADDLGLTFFVIKDKGKLQRQYGINAFPTSLFVDSEGIIQSRIVGDISPYILDAELAKIGLGD